ncbi:MAG: glycosyltransferase family 2 protein [Armatimonadota bacterium]|jgi:GT2 family glycosyltransferase
MQDRPLVSVVMPTYERPGFLRLAVRAVLRYADLPFEYIIWNNASGPETTDWLNTLDDRRVRVVHSRTNVGCNAYELAFRQARGEWLVEMDDDVIDLPQGFLSKMVAAFEACPDIGYLALDVVRDETTNGGKPEEYAYEEEWHDGICLQFGPTGGWCTMTPRRLYEKVGFALVPAKSYFFEDGMYSHDLADLGYRSAILKGVRCYHAKGVVWNAAYQEHWETRAEDHPDEIDRMRRYLDEGIFVRDTQRPWSVRKSLGDCKRLLHRCLRRLAGRRGT